MTFLWSPVWLLLIQIFHFLTQQTHVGSSTSGSEVKYGVSTVSSFPATCSFRNGFKSIEALARCDLQPKIHSYPGVAFDRVYLSQLSCEIDKKFLILFLNWLDWISGLRETRITSDRPIYRHCKVFVKTIFCPYLFDKRGQSSAQVR